MKIIWNEPTSIDFLLKLPLDQMLNIDVELREENFTNVLKRTKKLSEFDYDFYDVSDIVVLKCISSYLSNLTMLNLGCYLCCETLDIDEIKKRT